MTTAETVAARLDGDGQRFETRDGRTLEELCEELGGREFPTGDGGTFLAGERDWQFPDGSEIRVRGHAWDFVWSGECRECGDVVSDELDLSRDGLCCGCAEDSLAGTEPGWMDAEPEMEGE